MISASREDHVANPGEKVEKIVLMPIKLVYNRDAEMPSRKKLKHRYDVKMQESEVEPPHIVVSPIHKAIKETNPTLNSAAVLKTGRNLNVKDTQGTESVNQENADITYELFKPLASPLKEPLTSMKVPKSNRASSVRPDKPI